MTVLAHDTNMDALGVEPNHQRGAFMSVYSGGKFYPLDPKPAEILIEDIAHALSHQNRFNGHLKWPYTVAQHSVLVSKYVEQRITTDRNTLLFALLHDAAEAYIGDVIRPVKYNLPLFKEIEDKIMDAVARKFGFTMGKKATAIVKTADNLMCAAEKRDLHPTKIEWPGMPAPLYSVVSEITPWTHSYAKGQFMRRFNQLT